MRIRLFGETRASLNTEVESTVRAREAENHVIIRDSQDVFDVTVVDLSTREVEWTSGWPEAFTRPYYV